MNAHSPRIGFDRFIRLEWAAAALRVRTGDATLDDLSEILDATHAGLAAKSKTLTVLNRLWLKPLPDLAEFCERGVNLYRDDANASIVALTWGMALATYPVFGKAAEIVGRLTAIQGDCTSADVSRRMAEIYGDGKDARENTSRILRSQENWGAIERFENGRSAFRRRSVDPGTPSTTVWLIEAYLRYVGRAVPVASIGSSPAIYPFMLDGPVSYALSHSSVFEMRVDGSGKQLVGIE